MLNITIFKRKKNQNLIYLNGTKIKDMKVMFLFIFLFSHAQWKMKIYADSETLPHFQEGTKGKGEEEEYLCS